MVYRSYPANAASERLRQSKVITRTSRVALVIRMNMALFHPFQQLVETDGDFGSAGPRDLHGGAPRNTEDPGSGAD